MYIQVRGPRDGTYAPNVAPSRTTRDVSMTDTPVNGSQPTGSDYICAALTEEGVETVFGLIGEGNAHFLDCLGASDLEFVYARHEQAAVTMADGYARLTNRVGVCTLTHGPGVTNGATGIAAADRDNTPLVVLIGDTDRDAGATSLQYFDHATFGQPMSVGQYEVTTPDGLPDILRRAFRTARLERGPVLVELPGDIQAGAAPTTEYTPVTRPAQRIRPDEARVTEAVEVLADAEAPLVLAGGGVRQADAGDAVISFAETVGAPVALTFRGKGAVSDQHPLVTGITGTFMTPASDAVVWDADVVVAVGAQLSGKTTRYGELFADADIIQIDIDPSAIGTHCDPTVGVVGDARTTLTALTDACPTADARTATVKETIAAADTPADAVEFVDGETGVDPREVTHALAERLPADTLVTVGSGNLTGFPAVFHSMTTEGAMFLNGNFGTMGYAVPAALGVQQGAPDRPVVSYTGDGALLQVLGEIETAVRCELPVIVVVLNDASYGIIRHRQQLEYGRETAASYASPEFAAIAEACGAQAATITSVGELDVVDEFVASESTKPLVLDVRTDPSVSRPGFPPY